MSLWARKPIRVVVVLLAVALAAFLAIKVLLPAEKIREMALEQARTRLGREVTVGDVSVSLKGGLGVVLNDVTVANPTGFPGTTLLAIDAVDVKLALRPLLAREIQVDRLVLDRPALNLATQVDGSNNFTFAQPTDPASAAAGSSRPGREAVIRIPHLTVHHAEVVYTDARNEGQGLSRIQIEDLNLDLSLDSTPGGDLAIKGSARTPSLVLTTPQPLPPIETEADLDLAWQMEPAGLVFNAVTARLNGVEAGMQGQIKLDADTPSGTLVLQLPEQALTALAAFAPPELADKISGGREVGLVTANLEITLPYHITGQAKARGLDLALAQPFLPPEQGAQVGGHADADLSFTLPSPDPAQL